MSNTSRNEKDQLNELRDYLWKRRKELEKRENYFIWTALIGMILVQVVIGLIYSADTAAGAVIVGIVSWIMGYKQCENLWEKEKCFNEYGAVSRELEEKFGS